jgi:predicted porin
MKKVLLGSTALLSAVLLSHSAMAQTAPAPAPQTDQPVKLGISGYLQGGFLANLKDSDNPGQTGFKRNSTAVQEYGLLDFSGDTKFSNGIGAGAFIEFYAFSHTETNVSGATSQIKNAWVHITGDSFGEVRIGDMTDVRRAQAVIAPEWAPDAMFSANSPNLGINNANIASNTTTACIGTCRQTQVAYYTPTLSGFKFGVSYAPDAAKGITGPNPTSSVVVGTPGDNGKFRDVVSATATWNGNVGPVAIAASAAITSASAKQNLAATFVGGIGQANPMIYNAGITATRGPVAVGAAYEQVNNPGGVAESSNKTFDVGATYTVGPYTFGAEYSRGIYKNAYLGSSGVGGTPKLNQFTAGGTYALGPGVSLVGGLAFNDYDAGKTQAVATGSDSLSLLMGTDIKF